MKPILSVSSSVASVVAGTPETNENPYLSYREIRKCSRHREWCNHDVGEPFEETLVVRAHDVGIWYGWGILLDFGTPQNFAVSHSI